MKRTIGTLWLVTLLFGSGLASGGCSGSPGAEPSMGEEAVTDELKQLASDLFAAYERIDIDAVRSFYAGGPDMLLFWERAMKYSWEEASNALGGIPKGVVSLKLSTTDQRVGGSGNLGWMAATFRIESEDHQGHLRSQEVRWTMVAEKRDGRWLIVHDHASYPVG